MSEIKLTDAVKKLQNTERSRKYNQANTCYILVNINRNTDAAMIKFLDNLEIPKSQFIRSLIREAMERYNEEGNNG